MSDAAAAAAAPDVLTGLFCWPMSSVLAIISQQHLLVALGYWHHRADERHGNPPQGNQELLVVRDKVGRPQVSLG